MKDEEPDLWNYQKTAQRLGIPVGTLYSWVHLRRIPHVRLGPALVRFRKSEIEVWLSQRAVSVAV